MNVAIIIAGGVGNRMGAEIPKQFIKIEGKPVLAYTLESFEHHEMIDAIEVVCVEGWENEVWIYVEKYGITKLKWLTKGGKTGQESIRNGVFNLENELKDNDIVIVHDGIRPLVDPNVLTDVINKC